MDSEFSIFVFYANGDVCDVTDSGDRWDVRIEESATPYPDIFTCEAFIKWPMRTRHTRPIRALVMSYFLVDEIVFLPGEEVPFVFALAGTFLYSIRLIYLRDQSRVDHVQAKGLFIPGDGFNGGDEDLRVSSRNNRYFATSMQQRQINMIYPVLPYQCRVKQVNLTAQVAKDITPVDISDGYRYMHIFYFEDINNQLTAMSPPASPLRNIELDSSSMDHTCVICRDSPADHFFSPCNHLCSCGSCYRLLPENKCPICRRRFRSVQRVYIT